MPEAAKILVLFDQDLVCLADLLKKVHDSSDLIPRAIPYTDCPLGLDLS